MKALKKPDGTLLIKKKVKIPAGMLLNTPKDDGSLKLSPKSREEIESDWSQKLKPGESQFIPWYPTYAKKEAKKNTA